MNLKIFLVILKGMIINVRVPSPLLYLWSQSRSQAHSRSLFNLHLRIIFCYASHSKSGKISFLFFFLVMCFFQCCHAHCVSLGYYWPCYVWMWSALSSHRHLSLNTRSAACGPVLEGCEISETWSLASRVSPWRQASRVISTSGSSTHSAHLDHLHNGCDLRHAISFSVTHDAEVG